MRAHDRPYPWRADVHGLRHRSQVRVSGQHEFPLPPRRPYRRNDQPRLGPRAAGECELALADFHAMRLGRIVEAEQTALHAARLCKLT